MSKPDLTAEEARILENARPFFARFYTYQKERFPFLAHGFLIACFSFSAVSYSLILRGIHGFVPMHIFLPGIFITITTFFLLRIFDEFKDAEVDAKYRKYLPVPRGLIKLNELRNTAIAVIALQLLVQLVFFPKMLWLYLPMLLYLFLMGKEFFVADWLRKKPVLYMASHMVIIPLVDVYASGLDWYLAGDPSHIGLLFFIAVSYMNGIVIEIGRKIRTPNKEEEGVETYTALYGTRKAVKIWILILIVTLLLAFAASAFAGYGLLAYIILLVFFITCSIPAFMFIKTQSEKSSKLIEIASGVWTIGMYLTLGAAPMIYNLIG